MVYGSTVAIIYRLKKLTKVYEKTTPVDWAFLVSLWIAGATGFWLEIAVAFSAETLFTQVIFVVHTILSMELVLLFAFSKFAHALYRPIALYFYYRENPAGK
jgi:nitrate reductase gamma subunit